MKILINSESLRPPLTGIGNYTLHLLQALQNLPEIQQLDCFNGHRITASQMAINANAIAPSKKTTRNDGSQWQQKVRESIRALPLTYKLRAAWLDYKFEQLATQGQYNVYHEPNFILKKYGGPSVTTIHDLSFIHYPQYHPTERVRWLSQELPKTLARADAIITDSNFVRSELLERYKLDDKKVTYVHLGVDARFKPYSKTETEVFLKNHQLEHGRYVLFVGTLEPRKGIDTLLDAWQQQPKHLQEHFTLVLAGAAGWCNTVLMERITQMQSQGAVRLLNFVDAANLPLLYAGASVFAYPSVYEGFGLPVLEAMASGVKVICAQHSAMSEFALNGACLDNPQDSEELALALQKELESSLNALPDRLILTNHASLFTWQACAKKTLAIYKQL